MVSELMKKRERKTIKIQQGRGKEVRREEGKKRGRKGKREGGREKEREEGGKGGRKGKREGGRGKGREEEREKERWNYTYGK